MSVGLQSALAPRGPEAAAIAEITWVLVAGGALIFAIVLVIAALALLRPPAWLASTRLVVAGGIVFPVVVLSALLAYALVAAPRQAGATPTDIVVEVVGHQWWWEVNYLDGDGAPDFATANEIRIPVGREVELRLRSADVLHSFWVPALAGKLDLIPGKDNRLRVAADQAGTFRGQCAEYCGGPHAQMALFVVAEDPARFDAWRAAQREPQQGIDDAQAAEGKELFLAHCASCHTLRGTAAEGELGPDLTHFASRLSLGAGIRANHVGTVAGWIAGNQRMKPGNLMPEIRDLDGDELRTLSAWLGTLK
ncbi:MAG: c-type cytochrome [Aromatoleum sp.]|uniref:cytochrome c oxidase subunit II n=1 Tax=Aromatoleum sp. TaxID=2307007 RepID=UPI00289486D6|nr:c-type cytochrome [Aromatoleum sp.]MDT3669572.1 c-type cytochrome [Aromatoleum sp.]